MLTVADRPIGVDELKDAVAALRRGDFRPAHPPQPSAVSPRDKVPECAGLILVLAGHAGAGASTVAVAIADALASSAASVLLVDAASPGRSGLAAVTNAELGEVDGWRTGRRGTARVVRTAADARTPREVPAPPVDRHELAVVDAGWPAADVLGGGGWLSALSTTASVVLVFRVTVPGVQQTDRVASRLSTPPVMVAIGPRRWPGPVLAASGPAIRSARAENRLTSMPIDRRLQTSGVDDRAMPKTVASAAAAAARFVTGPNRPPGEPGKERR